MTLPLTDPARLAAFFCSSPIDDPTCVEASLMCNCACCAATPMSANRACISPVAARTALAAASIPDWRSSVLALMTTLVSMSAIIASQLREDHAVSPQLLRRRMRASILCHLTPQFSEVEYDWRQPGVNILGSKPGSKLSEDRSRIGARRIPRFIKAWSRRPPLLLADPEIRPD